MSWTGSGPTSAQWYGNLRTQPITITSNYEYLNVRFLSTTLTTASTINAINVNSSDVNTNTLSTFQIHLSSNTILTGGNGSLYINGILVTDASNASNVSQWADFPAIANINANNKNIINLTSLFGSNLFASNIYNSQTFSGSNINTSTLTVRGQFTGSNITASNILIRNTVSAANGNFTTTTANDGVFVNTTSVFTNTTLLASVNGTITTLSNTNFKSRTANISNFYGKLMYGENLFLSSIIALSNIYGATIEGETLDVARIITDTDIYGSNLFVSTIVTEGLTAGGITIGATIPETVSWNSSNLYGIDDVILYNSVYYIATAPSRAQPPTSNIIDWESGSNYLVGNYGFVVGVGSYRCIQNISGSTTSPNGDLDNWVGFSGSRDPTMWSITTAPTITPIGGIIGDGFSFITVGTGNFNTLNAPNISSSNFIGSNLICSNIFSQNINNTNLIQTNTLNTTGGTSVAGALTVGTTAIVSGNTTLNTLTTNGTYTANGDINLGQYGGNNMDINGRTYSYLSIDGTQTQWFNSINNILNLTTNELNVIGCATGNYLFPLRNNSIVNIGQTEFSPGIVNIYGLNLEDTYALSVYGSTYLGGFLSVLGDTTINGLFTVNAVSDLNGDLTVIGLTSITGDTDIIGLTSITGNTDINGACEITGETNILGALTVEAGIGVVGAAAFEGGDIVVGSSPGGGATNNFNVYIYYNGLDIQNITVNGTGDFRQNVSILGDLTARNFATSNVTASNLNVRRINGIGPTSNIFLNGNLIFENSNATQTTTLKYATLGEEATESFLIDSTDAIALIAQSNLLLSGNALCGLTSQTQTVIASIGTTDIGGQTGINITTPSELFAQADGNFRFNSFSNMALTATGSLGITGGTQTVIGSTGGNVVIGANGSNITTIGNLEGGPILIFTSNTGVSFADGDITFEAPGTIPGSGNIRLEAGLDAVIIGNDGVGIGSGGDIIIVADIGPIQITAPQEINIQTSNVIFTNSVLSNINTIYASNATIQNIQSLQMNTSNFTASNITTPALSTINISTASIFTNVINAPVNINVGKSLIPLSGSNLDLGASGTFRWRQLWVSTISSIHTQTSTITATNTMTASTITIDRIVGNASATNVFTNNLFPLGSGAQFGFGPALGSAGFYNYGFFRSTVTTNFVPASDGATTANNIKVAGHLSTISLGVSTINFKQYPFISTLSNSIVTPTATTTSGTPGLTRLQSNALQFPFPGTYNITQKYSITKGSGGGTHGCLIYDSNGATTTTVANANNWSRMGMASVPFHDQSGVSTFTTAVTTVLANSANLTRDLYYYDSGSGNYTASFYIAQPTIQYVPSPGILPEI